MEMRGRQMQGWLRVDAEDARRRRARTMGRAGHGVRPLAAGEALGLTRRICAAYVSRFVEALEPRGIARLPA